jgi:hypothetical protein
VARTADWLEILFDCGINPENYGLWENMVFRDQDIEFGAERAGGYIPDQSMRDQACLTT